MSFPWNFSQRHKYPALEIGITLDTILKFADQEFQCKAKVDTGAQYCLFEREIGEFLGIDVENGVRRNLGTLAGPLTAFGHEITLGTLGLFFETTVYFSERENLPRNLLGREGWLRLIRLAIVDYDEELYLSPYDEQV
jgi:hypothetical protein